MFSRRLSIIQNVSGRPNAIFLRVSEERGNRAQYKCRGAWVAVIVHSCQWKNRNSGMCTLAKYNAVSWFVQVCASGVQLVCLFRRIPGILSFPSLQTWSYLSPDNCPIYPNLVHLTTATNKSSNTQPTKGTMTELASKCILEEKLPEAQPRPQIWQNWLPRLKIATIDTKISGPINNWATKSVFQAENLIGIIVINGFSITI